MNLIPFKIEKEIDNKPEILFPTLIQCNDQNYLVDCGYKETVPEFEIQLKALGVEIQHLTGVMITHDDYDHLGGLSELKKMNPRLKVFCGSLENESISGTIKSERLIQAEKSLHMMPLEYKNWALNFIEKLNNVEKVNVDKTFEDNEVFENDLIIIHTPGHTKGHISVYYPKEKTLIAGDALVVENDEFNIANPTYTLDMSQALNSVEKIRKLAPQKIICYHGGIIEDRIDEKLRTLLNKYT